MDGDDKIRWIAKTISKLTVSIMMILGLVIALLVYYAIDPTIPAITNLMVNDDVDSIKDPERIENGIHVRTGLIEAEGLQAVINNCTNCHSAQLVMQNRMDKDRWISTIRWMQRTQNLWELGDQEEIIVNYLIENYPPRKKGRRQALNDIQWYKLEN